MINCNGIYYKVYKTTWFETDGGIAQKIVLRPQEKLSCAGCPECNNVRKYISECAKMNAINLGGFANNTIVEPILSLWRDKETGNINDFDVEFVKAKYRILENKDKVYCHACNPA